MQPTFYLCFEVPVHRGRPIFYSLGNLAFGVASVDDISLSTYDAADATPGPATTREVLLRTSQKIWAAYPEIHQAVVAVSRYAAGKLVEVRLYPIDLGEDRSGPERDRRSGRPSGKSAGTDKTAASFSVIPYPHRTRGRCRRDPNCTLTSKMTIRVLDRLRL